MRSSLEYCGAIWDPSGKEEEDSSEVIQQRAARWVRGAYGVVFVTVPLCDLSWLNLAYRQWSQHLCLFYKILHSALDIPPGSIDIPQHTDRTTRSSHPWKLNRVSASDRHSPLWKATVIWRIPQWNRLSIGTVGANSLITFKSWLSARPWAEVCTLQPSVYCLIRGGQPTSAGLLVDYQSRSRLECSSCICGGSRLLRKSCFTGQLSHLTPQLSPPTPIGIFYSSRRTPINLWDWKWDWFCFTYSGTHLERPWKSH